MTEHTATQQEIQKLSERYTAIKDKAKVSQGCQTVGSRPVLTFVLSGQEELFSTK